ncbi:MAG: adenylyltransferase/cytidyltransferase family protein [Verrucomicrobia bacterium]|nr:adenylyltransferase/cytidyltransferase family protein [Verrucomicrobiota bacterium]
MKQVIITGSFDDLKSRHIRLLEEASKLGELHVLLWSDRLAGNPKFPEAERLYLVQAIRYVSSVRIVNDPSDTGPIKPDLWANEDTLKLDGFPVPPPMPSLPGRKKVIVTGCYDWFHSGHVRFFEEVSQLGDLYVCIGNDANIELLKGIGHPFFQQEERRYVIGSVRHVKECRINTGTGWLDAEPEMYEIKPDIYAVNEDGDRPEKREFCARHGIQYVVLQRTPKDGLLKRSSTGLRGF